MTVMTLSLARLSGFSLCLVFLAVASAGAGGYFFIHTLSGEYQTRSNQLAMRDAQVRVETSLRQYQQTLAQIAGQEEMIPLMGTDKTTERNAKAAQLAGHIPFAMKIRLFARGRPGSILRACRTLAMRASNCYNGPSVAMLSRTRSFICPIPSRPISM